MVTIATAKFKPILIPDEINTNPHTKDRREGKACLSPSIKKQKNLLQYLTSGFQQQLENKQKDQIK